MMDNVRNFLRGVMDLAMVVIPLSVVLGVIFGPAVPFIGADVIDNISALESYKISIVLEDVSYKIKHIRFLFNAKMVNDDQLL